MFLKSVSVAILSNFRTSESVECENFLNFFKSECKSECLHLKIIKESVILKCSVKIFESDLK